MRLRFNWGTGITLVYITFALGTVSMVGLAVSLPTDLVSEDYYGQSLQYDQRISATERADALGPALVLDVDSSARTLTIALPPGQRATATGTVTFYRPSRATADRTFPLTLDSSGRSQLSLGALPAGVWHVRLEWAADGASFYRERTIVLP